MKKIWMQLPLLLAVGSSALLAGDLKRFELQPFGGFSASGGIPLIGDDGVDHGSVHVSSTYNLGATFAINLNELDAVEAFWQRQLTDGHLPSAIVVPYVSGSSTDFDLRISQYHCNFLHHYLISDPRAMPYVMAGLGATTYRANRTGWSGSKSYFSFALGGGMKYYFTKNFGIRGEARWSPTLISASDSSFWCSVGGAGAACVIHLKTSLQQQMDVTGGIIFRF
jgi:hypothetical protein